MRDALIFLIVKIPIVSVMTEFTIVILQKFFLHLMKLCSSEASEHQEMNIHHFVLSQTKYVRHQ